MPNSIKVDIYELNSIQHLEVKWCDLAVRSNSLPFLDWGWISSWLGSLPVKPFVLEATHQGKTVGLGLLCEMNKTIFPGIKIKQLWLHRTGQQKYDQIWIEHNDFLLDTNQANLIRTAMIQFLYSPECNWDEFYLGMSTEAVESNFNQQLPKKRVEINSPSFIANLKQKNTLQDYLTDLSKNTRSQINRTKRLLEQQGSLSLVLISSHEKKQQAFSEISVIHQNKWGKTEFGSGFSNNIFVKFHNNMLQRFPTTAQLYCVYLDNISLAYIYVIKSPNTWYFYLSAVKKSDDNRVKIGLLAHALVIEDAILNNVNTYSFLAGYARYKKSMSNTPESIQQLVCYYKPSLLILLRERLRRLKHLLFTKSLNTN